MRALRICLALAILSVPAAGVPAEGGGQAPPPSAAAVPLPRPATDGKVSVEAALQQRRSVRTFAAAPLSLAEVAQLCWAAQGVTDEKGHRTAPSARAVYPLQLWVLAGEVTGLPAGLYRYDPAAHALRPVAAGDRRAELDRRALGQAWMQLAKAPAVFAVTGDPGKFGGGDDPVVKAHASAFTWVEAGLATQGFFLQATALGLGSTYVGGFKAPEAREILGLPATEELLALLPVGRHP
jgi:SagB-type dehydrogenase family enzyme